MRFPQPVETITGAGPSLQFTNKLIESWTVHDGPSSPSRSGLSGTNQTQWYIRSIGWCAIRIYRALVRRRSNGESAAAAASLIFQHGYIIGSKGDGPKQAKAPRISYNRKNSFNISQSQQKSDGSHTILDIYQGCNNSRSTEETKESLCRHTK